MVNNGESMDNHLGMDLKMLGTMLDEHIEYEKLLGHR